MYSVEAVKVTNFRKFHVFLNIVWWTGKLQVKYFCCIPEYSGWFNYYYICVVVWAASRISCFFHRTSFLLERMPSKLWLFRLGYIAHIFLKMNIVSLSCRGKQLVVFVSNDKNWAFKWKLEFLKMCNCDSS